MFPKFIVNNWTIRRCQSCILQGQLSVPAWSQPAQPRAGRPCQHWLAALNAQVWKLHSPSHQESRLIQAQSCQPKRERPAQRVGVCSTRGAQSCTAGVAQTGLLRSWIPGVPQPERFRRPGSTGSCRVTMTPLSGLWLLLVVELTSIYMPFSNQGDDGVLGSRNRALNLILGCFWKHFFCVGFFFLILTLRLLLQVWLDYNNNNKNLLTNWKPCTSASSTLQFNCFKAEAMCCVLSGVQGKVKWKAVKKKIKIKNNS